MKWPWGAIVIGANRLGVNNGSAITVTNTGSGLAGDISIFANLIAVNDGSEISAETQLAGEGGNIELFGDFLVLTGNSNITTDSGGNGGNIALNIQQVIYGSPSRDSNILARGGGAEGGNITFLESIFLRNIAPRQANFPDSNDITPTGRLAEGTISFRSGTQDLNPVQEQVTLPADLVDPSRLIAEGCAAGNLTAAREIGEFVVVGRGGLPPTPSEFMTETGLEEPELIDPPERGAMGSQDAAGANDAGASSTPFPPQPWVEAHDWRYGENGEVVLTAASRSLISSSPEWRIPECHDAT